MKLLQINSFLLIMNIIIDSQQIQYFINGKYFEHRQNHKSKNMKIIKKNESHRFFNLYTRIENNKEVTFLGIDTVHHKINLRSHLEAGLLNSAPYYWLISEFDFHSEILQPYFKTNFQPSHLNISSFPF
jgi:hypothetical protein